MIEERVTKRREWVKNAAIIFLVIMLILTFFSNTIMNWSLPEVAAQYPRGMSVSEQIRGSGNIEASESFDVMVEESRAISSVLVKVGDKVEKGQPLILLEDIDSDELTEAKERLEKLNLDYQIALLSTGVDYSLDYIKIKNIEEDIALLRGDIANVAKYQAEYEKTRNNSAQKRNTVTAVERELEDFEAKSEKAEKAIRDQMSFLTEEIYSLMSTEHRTLLENAEEKKESAEAAHKRASDRVEELSAGSSPGGGGNLTAMRRQIAMQQNLIVSLNEEYWAAMMEGKSDAELSAILASIRDAETTLRFLRQEYREAAQANAANTRHEHQMKTALTNLKNAENSLDRAKKELDDAKKKVYTELLRSLNGLADTSGEKVLIETRLTTAKDELERAKEEEAEAKEKASLTVESINEEIRALERSLEQEKTSLSQKQTKDLEDAGIEALNLRAMQNEITKQEQLIARLTEKTVGFSIDSPVSGTISGVNCAAGTNTKPDVVLISIDITDLGFSLSFAVTAEQAQRVRVGDTAEVLNFWFGNAEARLASIRPDHANPGRSRLLVFSVTGDVEPGQELQIALGSRGQPYELVVPNSAIREDNNGKFVLVLQRRSSPLGDRWVAQRTDISVLATDGTNSAISGALAGGDFIITTATRPVNPGDMVRIAS